jgi:hypothetical protein
MDIIDREERSQQSLSAKALIEAAFAADTKPERHQGCFSLFSIPESSGTET